MAEDKAFPTKLFWVDLEMTGLDAEQDVILEVGAEITDFDFKTLATYETLVSHDRSLVVSRMQANNWWQDFPANRDQFLANISTGKSCAEVEQELIKLVDEHFEGEPAILAGNSIHSDRAFIRKYMPALDLKLHYRMLDVTTLKIIMQGKLGYEYEKEAPHRAFDDIQASIAELQHYLEYLQKNGS